MFNCFFTVDRLGLLEKLKVSEFLAKGSKWSRFLNNPARYLNVIFFTKILYRILKRSKSVRATTFFDANMVLKLPSSADILLIGAKSHISEIYLARFIIKQLHRGDIFIDVGAHYGYFTLLASHLVGESGKVFSFEASLNNCNLLKQNTRFLDNVKVINKAVSDQIGHVTFYEFPNMFSEYNSIHVDQFKKAPWFKNNHPREIEVDTVVLKEFFEETDTLPNMIKIDVEGGEYGVIKGLLPMRESKNLYLIMEYLNEQRDNKSHKLAVKHLNSFGFKSHSISTTGDLVPCGDIEAYLNENKWDSDNFVFVKNT